MVRSSLVVLALASVAATAACASSPAMRNPLRDRLAAADTPTVEDAVRGCLTDLDFKVDPVGSLSGGSNVVSAKSKDKEPVQVYVHPPDQKPRVTGGPDDEKFWKCLASKLGTSGGDDTAADADGGGSEKKDDSKGKDDKGGDKAEPSP